jgi:hypothetical protein
MHPATAVWINIRSKQVEQTVYFSKNKKFLLLHDRKWTGKKLKILQ